MLRSVGVVEGNGIDVFLFGSAISGAAPNDIDLVMVYDKSEIEVSVAIAVRKMLRVCVLRDMGCAADVVLLSSCEAEETRFLARIDAVQVISGRR